MSIDQYRKASYDLSPKDLTDRVLHSIDLYMQDLQNESFDWAHRCECGINAITLLQELSNNIRNDIPEEEFVILIKVFGQIIKSINKHMRGQQEDLSKEFAGLRLIRKLAT